MKKIPKFQIPSFKGIKPLNRRISGNSRNEDRLDEVGVGSAMDDNSGEYIKLYMGEGVMSRF